MSNYVVIGGSSGIGETIANLLDASGENVWASYHLHPKDNRGNIKFFHLDVLSDHWDMALPDTIDGLVYCPGRIVLKPFIRLQPDEFAADFDLQVLGAVRVIQKLLPGLKKSVKPSIVLFSTVAVQTGFNFHSMVAASKGAIEGLTKALAAEFAPLIRVNAIAPSITQTPLAGGLLNTPEKVEASANRHPLKRIGTSNDMADAACFLLSEKSSWITGQILPVDGGISTIKL